jgi:hypothetical protein
MFSAILLLPCCRSPGEVALQYLVLFVCVGSAFVCVAAILVELSASFAYYGRAFKQRYIGHKKQRFRADAEADAAHQQRRRDRLRALLCCRRGRRGSGIASKSLPEGAVVTMPGQLVQRNLSSTVNPLHASGTVVSRKDSLFDTSEASLRRSAAEAKGVHGVSLASSRQLMSKDEVLAHRQRVLQLADSVRKDSVRAAVRSLRVYLLVDVLCVFFLQRKSVGPSRLQSLSESGALKAVKRLFATKPRDAASPAVAVKKAAKAASQSLAVSHDTSHALSLFMGSVSKLENTPRGSKLRLTVVVYHSKAKLDFNYEPGGVCARARVRACVCVCVSEWCCVSCIRSADARA